MLLALKQYLQEKKEVSLAELALHFRHPPEEVRTWLRHWERKGCVQCVNRTAQCGGSCQMCPAAQVLLVSWL